MRAMVLTKIKSPLELREIPPPVPSAEQVLIKISTCGVCRTDLHIIDGELSHPKLPLILGHQIVGEIEGIGKNVSRFKKGDLVGVPWLGRSCGECEYCKKGRENLCDNPLYTGYQIDGGFAEYCVADARFIFPISQKYSNVHAAPLLCAGLIGFRALRMAKEAKKIGFYGFGSSAHILTQVVNHRGGEVYAFTRQGDVKTQAFAKKRGAIWAGGSEDSPPSLLDAAIIFASVGDLVPKALQAVKKGGIVICAGIHMSDIPSFAYDLLWEERILCSVANLTRKDGDEFLNLAPQIPIESETHTYPLEKANEAIDDLRRGRYTGSAVLIVNE